MKSKCIAFALLLHSVCKPEKQAKRAALRPLFCFFGSARLRLFQRGGLLGYGSIFWLVCGFHFGSGRLLDVVDELLHEVGLIRHVVDGINDDILIAHLIPEKAVEHDGEQLQKARRERRPRRRYNDVEDDHTHEHGSEADFNKFYGEVYAFLRLGIHSERAPVRAPPAPLQYHFGCEANRLDLIRRDDGVYLRL